MATTLEGSLSECSAPIAKPLHLQRLQQAMKLDTFLNHVEHIFSINLSDGEETTDTDSEWLLPSNADEQGAKVVNGILSTKLERRSDKARLYNFSRVKKGRKWLKNLLVSDSSNDEDEEDISEGDLKVMLKMHVLRRKCQEEFHVDKELKQYQYYSVGLLSNYDRFPEHQKSITGNKKKAKEKKLEKKMKAKLKKIKKKEKKLQELHEHMIKQEMHEYLLHSQMSIKREGSPSGMDGPPSRSSKRKNVVLTEAALTSKRRKLWISLSKKEIPRAQKQKVSAHKEVLTNCKKMAQACQKEIRKTAIQFQKSLKETPGRARRLTREMLLYWKRYDRVEKELRKRAEKEAQEQLKMDIELREAKRQQRKLNFLITQTELYAHFMSRKMGSAGHESMQEKILSHLEDEPLPHGLLDDYDSEEVKAQALENAKNAYEAHQAKSRAFDNELFSAMLKQDNFGDDFRLTNPSLSTEQDRPQPGLFKGKLKVYQLKGMNWLANLYDQGINGILADEMGLGKTVQSIAFLAHIAESQDIWGPFLVIAPASTLHNWQQEFSRFLPKLKVLPYWGNTSDRKILRKFWNQKELHTEDASFHVLITSYQLVVQDVKYFQRIKWQYMVLDEAQAIKSSSSVRWKILLGFNCRNRLLLTGTPIQNSMAELWALLHFIMPTLFDSHEEFNEWFSKDIENHAENKSTIDEKHLSRLHMILKPFMLRRIKKDVENELSDKIEILLYCHLTTRQKRLYQGLKQKISIEDLLHSSTNTESTSQSQYATSSLMNLVMQFRKVCNHPELFERREVKSPYMHRPTVYLIPKLVYRQGMLTSCLPSKQHLLHGLFNIYHPENVHRSLFANDNEDADGNTASYKCFSFSRFISLSPKEIGLIMCMGLLERWLLIREERRLNSNNFHRFSWHDPERSTHLSSASFFIELLMPTSLPSIETSRSLQDIVFTERTTTVYTRTTHVIHSMPETAEHRKIRMKKLRKLTNNFPNKLTGGSAFSASGATTSTATSVSPTGSNAPKSPSFSGKPNVSTKKALSPLVEDYLPEFSHRLLPPQRLTCQLTVMPPFLMALCPRAVSFPLDFYCSDRSASWWRAECLIGTGRSGMSTWKYGHEESVDRLPFRKVSFCPSPLGGSVASKPLQGWSDIIIPDKETLVTDSGKLNVLDGLLTRLKAQGHRVLIYSQMTRMIDLLEEYMWHRKHTYMRLDGSSKISERRDMVADFQTRSDIFVFLLSTRAGGLGINLTAADTVVFYDSDWNPTVDQQAMDRAHRLGQTKQVTVYRLICKGTIEERILQRAREKSEIQRMVISGGSFKPDTLKPKEVVSLLLDDDELERKFRQRQAEGKQLEDQLNNRDKRRKREKGTGEKRGRGGKRPRIEENITIPASQDTESVISIDSIPPSPSPSEKSYSSAPIPQDETSNEGSLVVDDGLPLTPQGMTTSTAAASVGQQVVPKKGNKSSRGTGRGRGRPKGSGKRGITRGRGGIMAAAEMAGAQAGATAAYAAYGYSVPVVGQPNIPGTNLGRGHTMMRGTGVRMRGPINQGQRFPYNKDQSQSDISVPTGNPVATAPANVSGSTTVEKSRRDMVRGIGQVSREFTMHFESKKLD